MVQSVNAECMIGEILKDSLPKQCPQCGRAVPDFFHHVDAECMDWPEEPDANTTIWYRGWECGWNEEAHKWAKSGWRAYKGGADLDAPTETNSDWFELLHAIDLEEGD